MKICDKTTKTCTSIGSKPVKGPTTTPGSKPIQKPICDKPANIKDDFKPSNELKKSTDTWGAGSGDSPFLDAVSKTEGKKPGCSKPAIVGGGGTWGAGGGSSPFQDALDRLGIPRP